MKLKGSVKVIAKEHTHKFDGKELTKLGKMAKCELCHLTAGELGVNIVLL